MAGGRDSGCGSGEERRRTTLRPHAPLDSAAAIHGPAPRRLQRRCGDDQRDSWKNREEAARDVLDGMPGARDNSLVLRHIGDDLGRARRRAFDGTTTTGGGRPDRDTERDQQGENKRGA